MHILIPFKDKNSYSFKELLEKEVWNEQELNNLLNKQVKRKRLRKRGDIYTLNNKFYIGYLDLKEGFGFLRQEENDLYLEDRDLADGLNGDLVLVRRNVFNKVVEILERSNHELVCSVKKIKNRIYLIPKSYFRFPIRLISNKDVLDGEVLLIELKEYQKDFVAGVIKERIGFLNDPDIDVLTLVYEYGFPYRFSKEALKEARELDRLVKTDSRFVVKDEYIVTIDGEDAKDLDDAISLKMVDDNYHLSVHIADVSYYVTPGSEIDKEAFKRATSAYLADRVIPMLPQRLSNDLCSLTDDEKYTLSVFMEINKDGKLVSHEIKETVIKVDRRLSYNEVNNYFAGATLNNEKLELMLDLMLELRKVLYEQRYKDGSLNFESPEYQYILDKDNNIVDIIIREEGLGESIIEEFMVLTNKTVGSHLYYLDLPSIYRVHERPKTLKLKELFEQLKEFKIRTPKHKNITSKTIQTIIENIEDNPNKLLIHELLLKSMNRAKYDRNPLGHFGLAINYYGHFTAPIRRYPDLLLHRIVKDFLVNPVDVQSKIVHYEENISKIAEHSSYMERLSIELEREVDKLKIAQFMENKIGEKYQGTISGLTKTGIFVKINKGIEGMVQVRGLNGYYVYNRNKNQLKDHDNNVTFRLGDKVLVELIDSNIDERRLTFRLVK